MTAGPTVWPVAFPLSLPDGAPVVMLRPAGVAADPALEAALLARLAAVPAADLALAGEKPSDRGDDDLPSGVWLLRRLQTAAPLTIPTLAVRAGFLARIAAALPPGPPPAAGLWPLAAVAAGRVAVVAGENAAQPSLPDDIAGLDWLRRVVGRMVADRAAAVILRQALLLALADRLCVRPVAAGRAPAPVIRRLIAGLPAPGQRRMARGVLRAGVAAAAVTLTARARPRPVRPITGLTRGGNAIIALPAAAGWTGDAAARWDVWTYIGTNGGEIARLQNGALAGVPFEPAEPALEETAFTRRAAFAAAWAGLMDARPNRWGSMVADLSPDTSTLYPHACHVLTALALFARNDGRRRLVVVEQPALFRVVVGALAPDPGERPVADAEPDLFGQWRRLWRRYLQTGRRWRRRLDALADARRQCPAPPFPADPDLLFATYIDDRTIGADGLWRDRYFGDLPDWLARDGRRIGWLWFDWAQDIDPARLAGLAARHAPALTCGELVGWRGVVAALLGKFNAWRAAPWMKLSVDGVDLGGVLRLDLQWAVPGATDIDRLLFRGVGRALARAGIRPQRIVYPFENQGWERMLCAGVHRHLPGVPLTAYVHAAYSPYCLSYYPTPAFWSSPQSPDRVVALSEPLAAALVADDGYPAGRVVAAGALRYPQVFAAPVPPRPTGGNILAALPGGPGDALELVRFALAPPIVGLGAPIVLKPHPTTIRLLRPLLTGLPPHVQVFDGSMEAAIADCAVAIYSGGASLLDLLAHGRPAVIRAAPGRLPFFRLPAGDAGDAGYPIVQTGDPAAAAERIRGFLALDPAQRTALAARARALAMWWFSPPDPGQPAVYV